MQPIFTCESVKLVKICDLPFLEKQTPLRAQTIRGEGGRGREEGRETLRAGEEKERERDA